MGPWAQARAQGRLRGPGRVPGPAAGPGPGPGPMGPWALGPKGQGTGPWAPCGHVFSQRTQISSLYMYIKDIIGDEFLSKNLNFGKFLSQKLFFWRLFGDFPDLGQNQKELRRP